MNLVNATEKAVNTVYAQLAMLLGPDKVAELARQQADVVNTVLRQVVEHGTGVEAQFGHPLAGKTGTTQDYGDAWFIGYTPRLTAAVWMGYPEGQSRRMLSVHGKKVS